MPFFSLTHFYSHSTQKRGVQLMSFSFHIGHWLQFVASCSMGKEVSFQRVKQRSCEIKPTPPSTEVRNEWSYISTTSYAVSVERHICTFTTHTIITLSFLSCTWSVFCHCYKVILRLLFLLSRHVNWMHRETMYCILVIFLHACSYQ